MRRTTSTLLGLAAVVAMACTPPGRGRGDNNSSDCTSDGCGNPVPDAGTPLQCDAPLSPCGQECVNLAADPHHCGSCTIDCGADAVCGQTGCMSLPQVCPSTGCPAGSYCDASTNKCIAGCQSDNNCASSEICTANACVPGCRTDAACPTGDVCDQLKCRKACYGDADCALDSICNTETKACVVGCTSDSRCQSTEVCDSSIGQCRAGCRTDTQCPLGQICSSSSRTCTNGCTGDERCPSGQICVGGYGSGTCRAGCRDDSQCASGICDAETSTCRQGCRDDSACPLGEMCDTSTSNCVVGCDGDARCQQGQICDSSNGQCRAGCRDDSTCSPGQICDPSTLTCRTGCRASATCPLSQYCDTNASSSTAYTCQTGCNGDPTRCPDGQTCVAYTNGTYGCSAQYCDGNGACQGSAYGCLTIYNSAGGTEDSVCRLKCTSDSNCPSGDYCAPFANDAGFTSGWGSLDPVAYFCAKQCTSPASCSETEQDNINPQPCACVSGKCMSDPSGGYECYAISTSFGQ